MEESMKKLILILGMLLLLPSATAFSVNFQNLNNSVYPNQTATYQMTINNDKGFENQFQISTRDPNYVVSTDPSVGKIPSFSAKTYTVMITPKRGVSEGPHAVPIKIKSITSGQFKEDTLLLNVKPRSPFGGEYRPAVRLEVEAPSEVDPREKVPVTLNMENQNPRDMPELQVYVDGEVFGKEYQIHLNPLESKSNELLFRPDPTIEPGIYTLTVKLVLENRSIAESTQDFEVINYSNIVEKEEKVTNFFKITKDLTLTNDGNVEKVARKKVKYPFYQDLFVSFQPEPETTTENGKEFYVWSQELEPQETFEITITENYRIPVFIFFALVIAIVGYYVFRSPIVISKRSVAVDTDSDKTAIKVILEVKNRSNKPVSNVTVLDKLPNIADFVKKEEPGTLQPEKVVSSESKGTSIRWELPRLEPHEERIISYQAKCKLQIIGGMKLPPSKVKFETEKGKERDTLSNTASVVEA